MTLDTTDLRARIGLLASLEGSAIADKDHDRWMRLRKERNQLEAQLIDLYRNAEVSK